MCYLPGIRVKTNERFPAASVARFGTGLFLVHAPSTVLVLVCRAQAAIFHPNIGEASTDDL